MNTAIDSFPLKRRWMVFVVVFFLAVCVATNMMKAPPVFTTLIPALGFTDATVGWMVSSFALMGVILAFPVGGLLQKFGVKKLLLISGISTVLGSVLGALATNVPFMLASRFVEGIAFGLVSVVGIAAINTVMPDRIKGLAMGIWSVWYPVGTIISMLAAPSICDALGWQSIWWAVAVLALIATVLVVLLYAEPPQEAMPATQENPEQKTPPVEVKPDFRSVVLAALTFLAWNVIWAGAVNGFYPTYLQDSLEMSPQIAGLIVAIPSIIVLVLGPLSGVVSDRLGTRKWLMVFALVELLVLLLFAYSGNLALSWTFIIAVTLAAAAMPTGVFAIVPELAKRPESVGMALAILAFFQNIGVLAGSAAFGPVSSALGWQQASWFFLIPVAVFGLVCSLLIKEKRRKR
jgi:predicted MFS family arabinose efflux permease